MSAAAAIERLIAIMAALRDPQTGCPWDREQDFTSIAPYTIEEAYEVAEAIDHAMDHANDDGGFDALRDELGDLLLQVVFHARMAEEQGRFRFDDVAAAICDKLTRRHPHVFGDVKIESAAQQTRAWEALKAREQDREPGGERRVLDGVAHSLPALMRAAKLGRRAAAVGFDWSDLAGVADKVREELAEVEAAAPVDRAEEIGDLLFAVANLARRADVDPEDALRQACRKFERRFDAVETQVRASARGWAEHTPAELDQLWIRAKSTTRAG